MRSPRGKISGALFVTVTAPSTSSVAEASNKKAAIASELAGVPEASAAAKVAELGAVTIGETVSSEGVSPPEPPLEPPPQADNKKVVATTRCRPFMKFPRK